VLEKQFHVFSELALLQRMSQEPARLQKILLAGREEQAFRQSQVYERKFWLQAFFRLLDLIL
jgi:hypothetical protein